jgi:WD40 repeat protein
MDIELTQPLISKPLPCQSLVRPYQPSPSSTNFEDLESRLSSLSNYEHSFLSGTFGQQNTICLTTDCDLLASSSDENSIIVWNLKESKQEATLLGHSSKVSCLAISADDLLLASGSEDNSVILWNLQALEQEQIFTGHSGPVTCLAFSSDSLYLTSASSDMTVRVWNLQEMTEEAVLAGHSDRIICLQISKDNKLIASGSADSTIRIWSLADMSLEAEFSGHTSTITCLAFTHDSAYLSSGSADSTVRIWNLHEMREEILFSGHLNKVTCISISPDDRFIASGSWDATVRIWSIKEAREESVLRGHSNFIVSLAFSSNSIYLASSSWDSTVRIWSMEEMKQQAELHGHSGKVHFVALSRNDKYLVSADAKTLINRTFSASCDRIQITEHSNAVNCVEFSEDGKYVTSCSEDNTVILWNLAEREEEIELTGHSGPVSCCKVSKDSRLVISGSWDGSVRIWNIEKKEQEAVFLHDSGKVLCMAISNNSGLIASGSSDGSLILLNIIDKKVEKVFSGLGSSINCVIFSMDDKYLISGLSDSNIRVWNCHNTTEYFVLQGHGHAVVSLQVYENKYIISGIKDGTIKVWSLKNMNCITTLQAHNEEITSIQTVGRYLASGSVDCTIKIWNLGDFKEEACFKSHTDTITTLASTHDGRFLIVASADSTVSVWNMLQMKLETCLLGHSKQINSLAVSKSSKYLSSASVDSTISLWSLASYLPEYSSTTLFEIQGYDYTFQIDRFLSIARGDKNAKYASFLNKMRISPSGVNLLHLLAYKNESSLLFEALKSGCYFLNTIHGESPITICLRRNSRKSLDVLLEYILSLENTSRALQTNILESISHDIPELIRTGSKHLVQFLAVLNAKSSPRYIIPRSKLPIRVYTASRDVDTRNFERSSSESAPEALVEILSSRFAWNLHSGSSKSLELLESIYNSPYPEIYRIQFINSLIDSKWKDLYTINLSLSLLYLLSLVCIICMVFLPGEYTTLAYISVLSYLALNSVFIAYEVFQFLTSGLQYFLEFRNWFDIIRCSLALFWGICILTENADLLGSYYPLLMIATIIFCWIKGLIYFRTFKSTRIFVRMVIEVTKDTSSFLILLFYTTLAYAAMFAASSAEFRSSGFFLSLANAYSLDLSQFETKHLSITEWVVFVLATVVNCIIMLNLLISILGDSYERVQVNLVESDYSQMLDIIIEIEKLMIWNRSQGELVYLHECRSAEKNRKDVEWEGRLRILQDKIMNVREFVEKKYEESEEKNERRLEKIEENNRKAVMKVEEQMMSGFKMIDDRLQEIEERQFGILREISDKLSKLSN